MNEIEASTVDPSLPAYAPLGNYSDEEDEDEEICRVCRLGAEPDEPLFHPCKCRGSIKHVHQKCLLDWLEHRPSDERTCELCKHPLAFQSVYASDAPDSFSCGQVLLGVLQGLLRQSPRLLRAVVITISWFLLVPLLTRFMFRASATRSIPPMLFLLPDKLDLLSLGRDWQTGVLVCVVILLLSFFAASLQFLLRDDTIEPDVEAEAFVAEQPEFEDAAQPELEMVEDDMPMAYWFGAAGPMSFAVHVAGMLFYNFVFLLLSIALPLRIGHYLLLFVDVDSLQQLVPASLQPWFESVSPDDIVATALAYGFILHLALVYVHFSFYFVNLPFAPLLFKLLHDLYLVVKASSLICIELLICPILFGIALDLLTVQLRQLTVASQYASFLQHQPQYTLVYWLTGIAFVGSISLVASLLRRTLRRDVYRTFLRDPDDPEFQPRQELVHTPLPLQLRRLLVAFVIFLLLAVVCVHVPLKLALRVVPSLSPLRLQFNHAISLPADVLLMQLCLPLLFQMLWGSRLPLRFCQAWFEWACGLLSLSQALLPLPPPPPPPADDSVAAGVDGGRVAHMPLRVFALVLLAWATYLVLLLSSALLPLVVGRQLLQPLLDTSSDHDDVYSFLVGIAFCLGTVYVVYSCLHFCVQRQLFCDLLFDCHWIVALCQDLLLLALGAGLLPLLLGLFFELSVLVPLHVSSWEEPWLFLERDWTIGVVLLRLWYSMLTAGWLCDDDYRALLAELDLPVRHQRHLDRLFWNVCSPLLLQTCAHLALPYAFGHGLYPLLDADELRRAAVRLYAFAALLVVEILFAAQVLGVQLYERVRLRLFEDKYVVAQRLRNHA